MTEFLTTPQAARRLGISKIWLQKLAQAGRVGRKVGGRYLFTAQELEAFSKLERKVGNPNWKGK